MVPMKTPQSLYIELFLKSYKECSSFVIVEKDINLLMISIVVSLSLFISLSPPPHLLQDTSATQNTLTEAAPCLTYVP